MSSYYNAAKDEFDSKLPEARNLLSKSCGRRWSHGFYTSKSAKDLIKSDAIGAAGLRVGTVEAARDNGFGVLGVTFSPIRGPEGNIEFLSHLTLDPDKSGIQPDTREVVEQAHKTLGVG